MIPRNAFPIPTDQGLDDSRHTAKAILYWHDMQKMNIKLP
jgi:hypothetical protein